LNTLKKITIYTRGISTAYKTGGYGVILVYGSHRRELCGKSENSSNNRMDILAAVEGLRALKVPCEVTLYNTNTYLTDVVNRGWIKRWLENGWRTKENKPVSHSDLWENLLNLCSIHNVSFLWFPYDSSNPDYARCDVIAREAAGRWSADRELPKCFRFMQHESNMTAC